MPPALAPQHAPPPSVDASSIAPDVSIVAPLFNEAECIEGLMESLIDLELLLADRYRAEFILVDDGSHDDTAELIEAMIADKPQFRLIRHEANRGIAAAIFTGLQSARAPLSASIDADGSYDLSLLAEMLPLAGPETPLVTASPYHPQGEAVDVPAWRLGLSRLASRVYSRLMPQPLTCYTACFRVYHTPTALTCETVNDGFTGVAELLWRMQRTGAATAEFPAVLRPRQAGVSKMRVVRTMLAHGRLASKIIAVGIRDRVLGRRHPPAIPATEGKSV